MSEQSRMRKSTWFQAVLLGSFALVAAGLLAGADTATRDAIKERKAEDLQASLRQVIPPRLHDNDLLADPLTVTRNGAPLTVYQARRDGRVTAVAFRVTGQGYAGAIEVLMGVARSGEMLGARVLSHTETPGLGDKIEAEKDDWIESFKGRSLGNPPRDEWAVKKDGGVFDQFSGATITPRAVVQAVRGGLVFFENNRDSLLTPPRPMAGSKSTEEGA